MLQNTSKTLSFKKTMVYKTPPVGWGGGGGVNHIWIVAYNKGQLGDNAQVFVAPVDWISDMQYSYPAAC